MTLRRLAAAASLACAVAACASEPPPYPDSIAAWHAEKDRFMRESPDSPVPADKRATFPPLAYFPTDPAYRVPAVLHPAPSDAVDRDADLDRAAPPDAPRRHARLHGQRPGSCRSAPSSRRPRRICGGCSCPFGDLTNGVETYNGGRYLELDRTATGVYDLDFNRAFHPFCLYNSSYDCPYPPPESRLKVPIRAGEKMGTARH